MDRNLLSETDPLVERIHHANNLCTVGWTNFHMRLNPAGVALIKEIDPTAQVCNMYDHFTVFAMARSALGYPKFDTLEGFQKLWDYCANMVKAEGEDGFRAQSSFGSFIFHGFPYEVDCSNDSPLVGWFLVLGERNE
jgi:hypothetical protein